jgi:hypothetical protein
MPCLLHATVRVSNGELGGGTMALQSSSPVNGTVLPTPTVIQSRQLRKGFGVSVCALAFLAAASSGAALGQQLLGGAYQLLTDRAKADSSEFFVYQMADSGYNRGYPSGLIGNAPPKVNIACINDPNADDGCSTDTTVLEKSGTRVQFDFGPIGEGSSAAWGGLDFVEPQDYLDLRQGRGYDLSTSDHILFGARSPSPNGVSVQFGAGGATTDYVTVPFNRKKVTLICVAVRGNPESVCPPSADMMLKLNKAIDLKHVHILFTVVTNNQNVPNGGFLLLDEIRYAPFPASELDVPSVPLSTQTFGVIPVPQFLSGRVTVPPDQANRNIAALYEASLAILAFLKRGNSDDLRYGYAIADALVYALGHDNSGDHLPPPGGGGLHSAYESGDLPFFNTEGASKRGQVRLAGFSIASDQCGSSGYCLVLDGATGGNNAFAILALLKAYNVSGKQAYLDAAARVGNWIYNQLLDRRKSGFGGYVVGYPDGGNPHPRENGKSTENNADIFAAFTALAAVDLKRGDPGTAAIWNARAKIAGDFVMNMFDQSLGCFYAGTVPLGTKFGPGINPNGPIRGRDVTNTYDFFDSNSFTYLAMAQSAEYGNAIDWSKVVNFLSEFRETATAAGMTFDGYDIVKQPACEIAPTCGPNGVGWEFTGQAAVVINLAGGNGGPIIDQLRKAQASAPFGDGNGLVASTMQGSDTLPPYEQCLSTPFQCIPERVGIAATSWAIFAEDKYNPLGGN